jgi:hypothetical protein
MQDDGTLMRFDVGKGLGIVKQSDTKATTAAWGDAPNSTYQKMYNDMIPEFC